MVASDKHPRPLERKDGAAKVAVTRAYAQHQYHLLFIAFVASLYALYHQYASKHGKQAAASLYLSTPAASASDHAQAMPSSPSSPSSCPSPPSSPSHPPCPPSDEPPSHTKSIFLPYVYEFKTENVPLVPVTIRAGHAAADIDIDMPVDTGSTGLMIGAPLLPGIDPSQGTLGRQYLSSSNIVYVGRYLDMNLTFHGEAGSQADVTVPVLIVDRSWICPWYDPAKHGFECPRGPAGEEPIERDVSAITYMGVGFGRNKNTSGQRTTSPEGNPFLNVRSIDGKWVGSGEMRAGYIVSTRGIQLGLTEKDTQAFDFMDLEPGLTHASDSRDWAMPRMRFRVNGVQSIPGFALIDTGIPQMYIRAEDSMPLPEVVVRNPKANGTHSMVHRVKNGTEIEIDFAAVKDGSVGAVQARYSFQVGAASPMTPSFVAPGRQEPPPYVNTGRNFLKGYSIAFDAVDGRLGFQPVRRGVKATL